MSYLPVDPHEWFLTNVVVGPAEAMSIATAEQGADVWHRARSVRASGSRVGDMVGLGYSPTTPRSISKGFIWPVPIDTWSVHWGSANEINAAKLCEWRLRERFADYRVEFEYEGGIIISGDEWFVASVDGIAVLHDKNTGSVVERILLEFKCPNVIHATIKPWYYAQIQSYMGVLRRHNPAKYSTMRRCVFCQWAPAVAEFEEFPFDKSWFTRPRACARAIYFSEIVPRLILKDSGLLTYGQHRLVATSGTTGETVAQTSLGAATVDAATPARFL